MNISGYGVANNYYSGYGVSSNKAKTPVPFSAIPTEKPKTESKNNSTTTNGYDPFKEMAKTSSVSLPSWIYTKTEPTRSDEEILKDIAELAKKHAERGTFLSEDNEFLSLEKEYVSSVSPDRESILENSVKEINEKAEKISNSQKEEEKEKDYDMVDILLQVLQNIQKGENETISNGDGATSNGQSFIYNVSGTMYDAYVEGGEVKAAMLRDGSGETVMLFDNIDGSGLSVRQSWTEKELARDKELIDVYSETYRSTSSSKGIVSGNMFNGVG